MDKVAEIVMAVKEWPAKRLVLATACGVCLLLAWNVDGVAALVVALKQ